MFICKDVLSKDQVLQIVQQLESKPFFVGKTNKDKTHKDNQELKDDTLALEVLKGITEHDVIKTHSFIKKITAPRFNLYKDKGKYARHIDFWKQEGIRTDWSFTLFLTEPESYDGGMLHIEHGNVTHEICLEAGSMILYPSGCPHYVTPVTRGKRLAAIGWAESFVESYENRLMLGKLAELIKKYDDDKLPREDLVNLSFIYNNLLRQWSK